MGWQHGSSAEALLAAALRHGQVVRRPLLRAGDLQPDFGISASDDTRNEPSRFLTAIIRPTRKLLSCESIWPRRVAFVLARALRAAGSGASAPAMAPGSDRCSGEGPQLGISHLCGSRAASGPARCRPDSDSKF